MAQRARTLLLASLALVLLWAAAPVTLSSASFSSSSRTGGTMTAAEDWTPPLVSLAPLPATVHGTVELTALATDERSAVASVRIEHRVAGSWVALCTRTEAPYTCTWDTTSVADGPHALRAVATDTVGLTGTSGTTTVTVTNFASVTLTLPGGVLRGAVPLAAAITNPAGLPVTSLRVESAPAESGAWTTVAGCTASSATLSCTWLPATGDYDVRAVAVVGGLTHTDTVYGVTVDNVAPTVAMDNPGSPLSGTVTLSATASDGESGVASVVIEHAPAGTSAWSTACTITATPWSCRFDTPLLADGKYDLRARATDEGGNVATSTVVRNVAVNNAVASVSVENPGTYVAGTVTLHANANSGNGVASVRIQSAPHGTTNFTDVCADTTTPYSCDWVTTAAPGGVYDLRAVLSDRVGFVTTSALVTTTVDNSPLRALDVQAVSGGATVGRIDAGDQLVFTYSGQVDPASLLTGWDGLARTVTVRVRDGELVGGGGADDTLTVDGVNLGSANLRANYVKRRKTVTSPTSTVVATTATVGGVPVTVVTVTLGALGGPLSNVQAPATTVWSPSALARNLVGTACSLVPATEQGPADRDF